MKLTKTVQVPATQRIEIDRIVCELCKAETKNERRWPSDKDDSIYRIREVTIELNEGTDYPGAGSGIRTTIDLCPKCFRERLIPWIHSQGGEFRTYEWDF